MKAPAALKMMVKRMPAGAWCVRVRVYQRRERAREREREEKERERASESHTFSMPIRLVKMA